MIGQTVSHYRILEKLGEGGMGVVYVAEDLHLGRQVAIKFPSNEFVKNEFRLRFLHEARTISTLSHRHIAAIYDYGEMENGSKGSGQPFIVMELIKGTSLSELMNEGALTLKRAVEIIVDVAEALAEAHHHGVIHRDVKPSNVMVNERGEVKVLDFGLAKQLYAEAVGAIDSKAQTRFATQTRSGVIIGTPLYLSPEQAKGDAVDGRSDLFALGALLYECIAGTPAFSGTGVMEIAGQVLHVDPPPPSVPNPRVPPELDRITMKALAKKPEARYQSADEMLADLHAAYAELGDEDVSRTERLDAAEVRHASALVTLSNALRRPRLSLKMILIAAAILALIVWLVWRWSIPTPYKASAEAQRWHDMGTDALRDGLYYQASKAFEQAINADGNFALAHARYAESLMELDYIDKARDELLRVAALTPDRAALLPLDALYLDGVTASVRRDFATAIEAYKAIAQLSPNDPKVYVDLGRAYENNEEPTKALESYAQATALDQQYATAHLRAGVLYGRQQQLLPKAIESLDKADALYQALGKVEGRAEVLYQRGALLITSGKIAEARQPLQESLELAQAINNQPQQIKTMLQLVYVAQHQGETAEAQRLADDALKLAQANNMESLTARGLTDLGTVFFLRGNYLEAEKYFKQALELARRSKARQTEARALLLLGSLGEQQSDADKAAYYVEQALPFYQQGGYRRQESQALILLARVHRMKGDYEAAFKVYEQQLQLAEQTKDEKQKAYALEGMGTLRSHQERYPEALSYFEQRAVVSKSMGNQMGIGYSLIALNRTLAEMGRYDEARAKLDEALALVDRPDGGFKVLQVAAYQADAELALTHRQFAVAKEKSQKALALAGAQYRESTIEAKRVIGYALAHSGAAGEGRRWCEEASEMAARSKNPWLISRTQLTLSEVLLESGDAQSALAMARTAQKSFALSGQLASEWRALLIAARASKRLGNEAEAREYALQAARALSELEKKWGAEVYSSYSARPDVQSLRKRLSEEFALSKVN